MSRRKKDPLRPLTDDERRELTRLSRSRVEPAAEVARATMLLAVDRGDDYQEAARAAGRRSGDAVSHLVARFNAEGMAALTPRHGGGQPQVYDPAARQRILREARRQPTPESDGHGHLVAEHPAEGRSGRRPDGLPAVSTSTIWQVLREAGLTYQRSRTWCPTGSALRRRVSGPAVVVDADAESKKKLIEDAYLAGEAMGLEVWCTDQAGPFQTVPHPGPSWPPRGRAGASAARVPPRRHGQAPDALPPRERPGPGRGRDLLPEYRPARLAEARAGRRAGGDAPGGGPVAEGRLGAVAGGPDDQADAPLGAAAAADAPGPGQPRRAQDAPSSSPGCSPTASCPYTRRWAGRG